MLSKHDFHTVFISPMRRTLETTYNLFKNHPNFHKIKFVLHPHMIERLHVAADIPLNRSLKEVINDYKSILPNLQLHDGEVNKSHETHMSEILISLNLKNQIS